MPVPNSASSSGHGRAWGCPQGLGGLGAAKEGGQTPNPPPGLCPCRYTGERPTTNTVVIEAKLPSGYIPDKSSMVEVRSPCYPQDPLCPTGAPTMPLSPCPSGAAGHGGAPTRGAGPGWATHRAALAHLEPCPSS